MSTQSEQRSLFHDISIIIVSIIIGIILAKTDILINILTSTKELEILGSFLAGLFFTSVFTTVPAIATLAEIAQVTPLLWVATFGALGAVIGDLIIFQFVKDRLSERLVKIVHQHDPEDRISTLFKLKFFRWLPFFIGGLIIASPLPDELGISLLGISKMKKSWFIAIAFTFNFIGILLIGMLARSI